MCWPAQSSPMRGKNFQVSKTIKKIQKIHQVLPREKLSEPLHIPVPQTKEMWHGCCILQSTAQPPGRPSKSIYDYFLHSSALIFWFIISKLLVLFCLFVCCDSFETQQPENRLWDGVENAMSWYRAGSPWWGDIRVGKKTHSLELK